MKQFSYENQGSNTYLVYTVQEDDVIDSLGLGMLTNNKIAGFARTLFVQMDSTKFIKYNISAKVAVSQFFSERINKKRLVGVFSGIIDGFLASEDYMLDPAQIVLDLDTIFADVSTFETVLIYLPVQNAGNQVDLGKFFKGIMFNTQFDQSENCDYVAKIMNYLNSAPTFSPYDFKRVLDEIKGDDAKLQKQPQQSVPVTPPSFTPAPQPAAPAPKVVPPVQQQVPVQVPPVVQKPVQIPQPAQNDQAEPILPAIDPEDRISLFYLLQHYNKENAAKYKAQKAAKKQRSQAAASPGKEKKKKDKKKKTKKAAEPQYAIPGGSQPSFAVPGQSVPENVLGSDPTPAQAAPQPSPQQAPSFTPVPQAQPFRPAQAPGAAPQALPQNPQPQTMPQNAQPQTMPESFGETIYLNNAVVIGETTLLQKKAQAVQSCPHIIRTKTNERVNLFKTPFRLGKEKSYVDYCIRDNPAVSRSHAVIISRDGDCYIVDTNSTNHTYVNGEMVLSNTEVKLSHGARIRLANEEFEFKQY